MGIKKLRTCLDFEKLSKTQLLRFW